jgi:signal transduction histidine kinase
MKVINHKEGQGQEQGQEQEQEQEGPHDAPVGPMILVTVEDTGIGISDEMKTGMFQPLQVGGHKLLP